MDEFSQAVEQEDEFFFENGIAYWWRYLKISLGQSTP